MRACILFHGKGIVQDNAFVCRAKPYSALEVEGNGFASMDAGVIGQWVWIRDMDSTVHSVPSGLFEL